MKFIEYLSNGEGQQYWVNYLQGSPVSNEITYKGAVDGELQQQSIDEVNAYVQNAAGNRMWRQAVTPRRSLRLCRVYRICSNRGQKTASAVSLIDEMRKRPFRFTRSGFFKKKSSF